jgi:hypothetical protein
MNYILGATGTVGTAIRSFLDESDFSIIPKEEYLRWIDPPCFVEFLERNNISVNDSIYVCSGETNPEAPTATQTLINFHLPRSIVALSERSQCRILTFGSIFENFELDNPYLRSKRMFYKFLSQRPPNQNHKHFQLHTLYGINAPKPHMLLGQMSNSIKNKSIFKMSSGLQLREYWHGNDLARVISKLDWHGCGQQVVKVSSGSPFKLKTLALEVFRHFEAEGLLSIDSLPDPSNENYDKVFMPEVDGLKEMMREPFQGVISYLEDFLGES